MTMKDQTQLYKPDPKRRDAFIKRMFGSLITTMETQTIYLGLRLGYYDALQKDGPATSGELARRTGTDERYTREWLEQQAVAGILEVAEASDDAEQRSYSLSPEHAGVLLDNDDLDFLGFVPLMTTAFASRLPRLQEAFRTGGGIAWGDYGEDLRVGQGQQNRPFLRGFFAPEVLPAIKEVHERLTGDPPARVADIACGMGWAGIAIAEQYPKVTVDGLDLDEAAVEEANRLVQEHGLQDRVGFKVSDGANPDIQEEYDLVTIVESLHDMAHPVKVLESARSLLVPGGHVIVVDENTQDNFVAPGPETERAFYGFSVLACLANSRTEKGSAMTGTVIRPETVRRYAKEAGFKRVEIVPVEHDFFRFYLLGG